MDALDEVFGERVVNRGLRPPRSPDINPCDFCLWGTMKENMYVTNPCLVEELKEK
jgi:hypothetical protein